mgnify:FL=1
MLIFILIICLVSGCSKKGPYVYKGVELLKNGNMEEKDSDERPRGWGYGGTKGFSEFLNFTYTIDPTDENNNCLKIDGATDAESFAYWHQTISTNVPIGKKVKLKVKIKTDNLTGTGAAIAIRCDNNSGLAQFTSTAGRISIVGSTDWKYYSIELNERVRADIKSITVYLLFTSGNTTGTIYFDDASLIY